MADLFDQLMDSTVSVWKKGGTGTVDGYGIESQRFILVAQDVPCRYDPGPGKEITTDAGFGTQTYTFFMRPLVVDNPEVKLNIHHWLQINVDRGVLVTSPDENGRMFDIKNVKDLSSPIVPSASHFEIEALLIEP